ncbi:MAG: glycosyltransferase family 4 protein [Solirubrobacteraceae bacterium]|jgi:glycosyltransferase involved in cell wall biosynthesis
MSTPPPLRVGIAAPFDPRDMQADSGAAASVLQAMGELVAEAVPLSGALAPRLARLTHLSSLATRMRPRHLRDPREAARFLHSAAQLGRPTIAARNRLMRRRLQAAGPLDGIVQRGCELVLPPGQRFVTFEDSTVLQALSYPWPHLKALSDGDIQRYTERQRRVYAAARACCATTQWAADSITGSYGIEPERVFVVGLGQNHPPAQLQPRDWSTPRFLFVGVDWTRKNGPAVVQAFTRVRERHPNAQLDVVGGHPRLDVPGVVGHGALSRTSAADRARVAELYSAATAFVMPSLHEPAGIVYVEAGAAGVPSIGGSDGGAATMIGPGGLVVDPHENDQIYAAMLELANPQTAQRLGELAGRHASLFTWRKVAERLVRALAIPGVDASGLAEFL